MTAEPQQEEPVAPAITEAWFTLWEWSCGPNGQRRDWDGAVVKVAVREAKDRGVPYRAAWETLVALAWDLRANTRTVLGELANLKRPEAEQPPGATGIPAGEREALLAQMNEATRRIMGGTSVVPRQGTAGDSEATETRDQ